MIPGPSRSQTRFLVPDAPHGKPYHAARSAPSSGGVWKPADGHAKNLRLLLDTHIWVWMVDGDSTRLSPAVVVLLGDAAREGSLLISDISFREVANNAAKGRLSLSIDPVIWLERAARAPGVAHLQVDRSALIQSTRLRGSPVRDPADRILLATAQLNGAALVTCDKEIIDYAHTERGISVCDARD